MTYEEMMAMIGQGQENAGLEEQIKMQLAQAQALRSAGAPEMRQAGRVMVAPHPLELLAGLAQQYAGKDLQDQAMKSSGDIRANKQAQFAAMLRQMAGGGQPQTTGPGMQLPKPPTGLQMPESYGN